MDFHTFRDRLSTQGLGHSPVFGRHPGDPRSHESSHEAQFEGSTANEKKICPQRKAGQPSIASIRSITSSGKERQPHHTLATPKWQTQSNQVKALWRRWPSFALPRNILRATHEPGHHVLVRENKRLTTWFLINKKPRQEAAVKEIFAHPTGGGCLS
jgi:hypothetical protein